MSGHVGNCCATSSTFRVLVTLRCVSIDLQLYIHLLNMHTLWANYRVTDSSKLTHNTFSYDTRTLFEGISRPSVLRKDIIPLREKHKYMVVYIHVDVNGSICVATA